MKGAEVLNLENRKKIYDFILNYPGFHLRKIINEVGLSGGTIRYHIEYLIKNDLITKLDNNGYARYYVSNGSSIKNKKIISYLRNDNAKAIILFFCVFACGSLKTICKVLDLDKKDASIYLNDLLKNEIIEIAPVGKSEVKTGFKRCTQIEYNTSKGEKIYRLKRPYELNDILISFKNKFLDDGSTDDIIDFLLFLYKEKNNRPKKMKNTNGLEEVETILFDICPHPYHV